MKPLNLTDEQRASASIDYTVNKFELYIDGTFMSSYLTREDLITDLKLNKIVNATYSWIAALVYMESV